MKTQIESRNADGLKSVEDAQQLLQYSGEYFDASESLSDLLAAQRLKEQ
jgi:hypothetical protein